MKYFKKFSCDICDKRFSQQEELMHHKQNVHFNDLPYDCKKCNKFFSSMQEMRMHLQKYHSFKKDG